MSENKSSVSHFSEQRKCKQEPYSNRAVKIESGRDHQKYTSNHEASFDKRLLRRRKRSYERYIPNNYASAGYHKYSVKHENDSDHYTTSKRNVKEENRNEESHSSDVKYEHRASHQRRQRRTQDYSKDYRQRSKEPRNRHSMKSKPSYAGYIRHKPSFIDGNQEYFHQKRGGEEELRVLEGGKLRKKIYLPRKEGVNYIGLLIGPRGMNQKILEEETNCKILIRGNLPLLRRGHREGVYKAEDDDHEHVLIITDSKENMRKAEKHIHRVINATEEERNQIRQEQLKAALKISQSVYEELDESLLTPYGPPSPFAHIIPVPNECVGLIIGRGGETIRQLQVDSGAKIQVAKREVLNTNMRNVFIEGPAENYEKARKMIEDVVEEHKKIHATFSESADKKSGPHSTYCVPTNLIGLIIGRNGETIRNIQLHSNTNIFVPRSGSSKPRGDTEVEISGKPYNIERAKKEIYEIIKSVDYFKPESDNRRSPKRSEDGFRIDSKHGEEITPIDVSLDNTNEASNHA